MPEAIEYQILLDLQTALRGISVVGGYNYDVLADAVSIDPTDEASGLFLNSLAMQPYLIIEVAQNREITYFPAHQMREVIPIDIWAAKDAEPLVPASRLQTFQRLCADIEQALAVDVTRGGLATDTRVANKQPNYMVGGQRVVVAVQTEIRLYRTYGAPNG